jgi:hypothetical protein
MSIREYYEGGLLFLADDVAAWVAESPGCKCLYGVLGYLKHSIKIRMTK